MEPYKYMEWQRAFAKENGPVALCAPPGTNKLPLSERIAIYLEVFESGCTNTCLSGRPEECPECVRAFVDAIKKAIH